MKNDNMPAIRFAGFNGDWSECKLGDISKIYDGTHQTPKYTNTGVKFVSVEDIDDIEASNKYISTEDYETQFRNKPEVGDIFMTRITAGVIGATSLVESDNSIAYYVSLALIKPGEKVSSLFLNSYISTKKFKKELNKRIIHTAFPKKINLSDIGECSVSRPKLVEQSMIGNFLKQLDDTIALHQQELTILKQTKQGFLQKMFPKEGESVPELRFSGFTGDWEQRKMGDLSQIRRGASPRPIEDPKWFDDESDVGWLRIADVTNQNGLIHYVEQHISLEGQKKTLVLNEPHLILSIAATVGKPVINYIKTGVHDGFIVFINPKFNIGFMFQWLEMFRPKWQKYGQPGSQVNINSDLVREQDVFLPAVEEQEKISKFFKRFDEVTTLHQRELEILKETKKAFLQKMFV